MPYIFVRIFVVGRKKGEDNMPPKEESRMSDSLTKIEGVLQQMQQEREFAKQEREFSEKQLKMYQDSIEKSIEFNDERMVDFDKRMINWETAMGTARKTLWFFIVAMIPTIITGGAIIGSKASSAELDKAKEEIRLDISKLDHAEVSDVLDGDYRVIEDVYSAIEGNTDMTHEEARKAEIETKSKVFSEVTNYRAREIEKTK